MARAIETFLFGGVQSIRNPRAGAIPPEYLGGLQRQGTEQVASGRQLHAWFQLVPWERTLIVLCSRP